MRLENWDEVVAGLQAMNATPAPTWGDGEAEADDGVLRTLESGATRDTAQDKLDYEGFLHPLVLQRFAEYMHENRIQSDGQLRDSDNWQKGIPREQYMKSLWRHFHHLWSLHREEKALEGKHPKGLFNDSIHPEMIEAACAILFNVMGYIYEIECCR